MEILLHGQKYLFHTIHHKNYNKYKKLLHFTICDVKYITKTYELNAYKILEDDGFVGFFLTDLENSIIYCSIIFDLQCIQIEKYIYENGFTINECAVIALLCSNQKHRVRELTTYFISYILKNEIQKYKHSIEFILLNVSYGETNQRANAFYKKVGFVSLDNNMMICSL